MNAGGGIIMLVLYAYSVVPTKPAGKCLAKKVKKRVKIVTFPISAATRNHERVRCGLLDIDTPFQLPKL